MLSFWYYMLQEIYLSFVGLLQIESKLFCAVTMNLQRVSIVCVLALTVIGAIFIFFYNQIAAFIPGKIGYCLLCLLNNFDIFSVVTLPQFSKKHLVTFYLIF